MSTELYLNWLNAEDRDAFYNEGLASLTTEESIIEFNDRLLRECQEVRKNAYPDIEDYIDAIVKQDEAQVQSYIDACLAVKSKYPKV